MPSSASTERAARAGFTAVAWATVAAVAAIALFLGAQALPAIVEIGGDFLGTVWSPVRGLWGILPMLWGSAAVTAVALAVGLPLGVLTALFLTHFCPRCLAAPISAAADLLAGIPSVVYGFFGLVLLVPAVRSLFGGSGMSILTAGILLGIMILPTILSLTRTALLTVPDSLYRGARALGAEHTAAVFTVVLPAARTGIRNAALLGLGRAVGETMAVIMVAGNQARLPAGLLDGIRTLSTGIVIEMGYATGLHRSALIALALILFAIILGLNLILMRRPKAGRERRWRLRLPRFAPHTAAGVTVLILFAILGFVVVRGAPHLGAALPGLAAPAVTTLAVIALSLALSLPAGLALAAYLAEYARPGWVMRLVRTMTQTLAGLPSVVWGLFGMLFFVIRLGWGYSILAGGATMALMLLPIIERTAEEGLRAVDDGLRRGSAALGAGRFRTLRCILLPAAGEGIVGGIILAVGRVVGETAALLWTAGSVAQWPTSLFASGRTLAVHMYALAGEGLYTDQAYATALVLVVLVLGLNLAAGALGRRLRRKVGA
ncbi:MAG: phosphate ABC transporter permease subunit PstC [Clostridia bacterium]|nr:phosphate ABC transporter permease subunit PstC [Clostridia bacterium]